MEEPLLTEHDYRRRRIYIALGVFMLYIGAFIFFIISIVMTRTLPIPCDSKLAIVESVKIYTLYDGGKPTNTTFVDIIYIVNGAKYTNQSTVEVITMFNLVTIMKNNGVIKIYKGCSDNNFYLEPTVNYMYNRWYMAAIILGQLLFFVTLSIVVGCCFLVLEKRMK